MFLSFAFVGELLRAVPVPGSMCCRGSVAAPQSIVKKAFWNTQFWIYNEERNYIMGHWYFSVGIGTAGICCSRNNIVEIYSAELESWVLLPALLFGDGYSWLPRKSRQDAQQQPSQAHSY